MTKPVRRMVRYFNMVEIVIALGIISLGIVSIMGLFPIGINASRDAIAENYAADSADQFLHLFARWLKSDPATWASFRAAAGSKPAATAEDSAVWATFQHNIEKDTTDSRLYRINQSTAVESAVVSDFVGVYRVWCTSVRDSWNSTTIESPVAMALNVELSWPEQLPYAKRQKSHYYLELFNPNN